MYIDAHTHVAQESWVAETWWQALSKVGAEVLPGVTAEMLRETIIPALFDPDGSSQLGAMDAAGIAIAVMFPYDWSRAKQLGDAPSDWKDQNQWYRDFAARQPDRIRWGCRRRSTPARNAGGVRASGPGGRSGVPEAPSRGRVLHD